MISGIYKITNVETHRFYIGSSKNIDGRWVEHRRNLNDGCHVNQKLQNAWNLYGEGKFRFDVIELVDLGQLIIREQFYLDTFKPYLRDVGYNICSTASGGDNITNNPNKEQFIEKMKTICSGENNPMFGKRHSNDSISIQKRKAKGRFTRNWFIEKYGSEGPQKYQERIEKLRNRKINYVYSNNLSGRVVGKMTDECKLRIKESKSRMKTIKPLLYQDIKDGLLTVVELSTKYNLGMTTVKYHKRKIKNIQ